MTSGFLYRPIVAVVELHWAMDDDPDTGTCAPTAGYDRDLFDDTFS